NFTTVRVKTGVSMNRMPHCTPVADKMQGHPRGAVPAPAPLPKLLGRVQAALIFLTRGRTFARPSSRGGPERSWPSLGIVFFACRKERNARPILWSSWEGAPAQASPDPAGLSRLAQFAAQRRGFVAKLRPVAKPSQLLQNGFAHKPPSAQKPIG